MKIKRATGDFEGVMGTLLGIFLKKILKVCSLQCSALVIECSVWEHLARQWIPNGECRIGNPVKSKALTKVHDEREAEPTFQVWFNFSFSFKFTLKRKRWWQKRVAVISAKNHKRQRRKRQCVTAKREKSQTPKVLTAILTLLNLT